MAHCGTEQTVLKRVEKFLDERDYLIKKCSRIVILDGVMCQEQEFSETVTVLFFLLARRWLEKVK